MKERELKLWWIKFSILFLFFLPSLTNFFSRSVGSQIIPGISLWQLIYFFLVFFVVLIISGRKVLVFSLAVVSLLSISIVFIGALVACLRIIDIFSNEEIYQYSSHYISLLVTMLTVVPISIAVISSVPFKKYELLLLNQMRGISIFERILLMGSRVFNHVYFDVIPNIILVKKEERHKKTQFSIDEVLDDALLEKGKKLKQKVIRIFLEMTNTSAACICLSLEHIPLWALEISNLPSQKPLMKLKKEKKNGETKTNKIVN
jgi:hypothetical protein